MSNPQPTGAAAPALALVNARIWTNDPARRWVDALLARDGLVVAVGSSAELRKRAGTGARVVDARGLLVLPTDPEESLRPGAPATLVIIERGSSDEPPRAAHPGEAVFELALGRVVVDRLGLAT